MDAGLLLRVALGAAGGLLTRLALHRVSAEGKA
jgi:hypothetical protein